MELLMPGWLDKVGLDHEANLLVLWGKLGLDIPGGGANAFGAVSDEPIDAVLTFTDVEATLKVGITFGVFLDGWNSYPLDEVSWLIWLIFWGHSKQNREHIFGSGQFPEGDGDIIAGVEAEVETEEGVFFRADDAGQIFARLTGFKDGHVSHLNPGNAAQAGADEWDLRVEARGESSGTHEKHAD